jgi:hypothetical protein
MTSVGIVLVLFAALLATAQNRSVMPRIEGQSLAGRKLVLPDAAAGQVAVLIFGFTRASKSPTSGWAKKLRTDFPSQSALDLFQIPVLEDVPRLIRGMVISGIRKGVPENQRDHFLIVIQSEAELKKFVGYKEADDAYLVVLDPSGRVVKQLHGRPEGDSYAGVKELIESLRKH